MFMVDSSQLRLVFLQHALMKFVYRFKPATCQSNLCILSWKPFSCVWVLTSIKADGDKETRDGACFNNGVWCRLVCRRLCVLLRVSENLSSPEALHHNLNVSQKPVELISCSELCHLPFVHTLALTTSL